MPTYSLHRVTITLLTAAICSTAVNAQEPVLAIATYRFSQLEDTTNSSSLHSEYTALLIGRDESLYQRAARTSEAAVRTSNGVGQGQAVDVDNAEDLTRYYVRPGEHQLVTSRKMFLFNYIYALPYPAIEWEIGADTVNIGGFRCQRAKGRWKGRCWWVCFCPELPFRYGPWKLTGLPGLILQAADSTGQVSFRFEGFRRNDDPELRIGYPTDHPVRLTEKEFNRLHRLFTENPRAYLETFFGPQGMGSVSIDPSFHGDKKISNPIELGGDN